MLGGQDPWEYRWFGNRTNYQTKNNILSRRELIDCNWARTQNHLVGKRTLNHLAKLTKWISNHLTKRSLNHLAKWLSVRLRTKWFWVQVQLQLLGHISFKIWLWFYFRFHRKLDNGASFLCFLSLKDFLLLYNRCFQFPSAIPK